MREPRNLAASIAGRLRNRAGELGEDYERVLGRFGVERLLARLSALPQGRQFVLKGGLLFYQWGDLPRTTRDVDLLAVGVGAADLEAVFRAVCGVEVEPDDALAYLPDTVTVAPNRLEREGGGRRVKLLAMLGKSRITVTIDIGFGDVVVPPDELCDFRVLLDEFPAPSLRVYRRETLVAEKWEAMIRFGSFNSRLKDFFDVWYVARRFEFNGELLAGAIEATCSCRGTELPSGLPEPLGDEFGADRTRQAQWAGFLQNVRQDQREPFGDVIELLRRFLLPPTQAVAGGRPFRVRWPAGGPWQDAPAESISSA